MNAGTNRYGTRWPSPDTEFGLPSSSSDARTSPNPHGISLYHLYFALGAGETLAPDVTVYERATARVAGRRFTFKIIGKSHHVIDADGTFSELCACTPLDDVVDGRTETADLEFGIEREFGRVGDGILHRVGLSVIPIDAIPSGSFDLVYRFASRAITAIDVYPSGFETYHTYPERDIAARTRTAVSFTPSKPR